MPSVSFYFEVHQPFRVRPYGAFDHGTDTYFHDRLNAEVMRKVARKCYLPTNETLLRMIESHEGRFRIAFSITGVAIEQMRLYAPEVIDSFRALAKTGCVEFLGETYYHSLASLFDPSEFHTQVRMHTELMLELFGQRPRIFRNTELIYDDNIAPLVAQLGFEAMLAEGADDILQWRSPAYVYQSASSSMKLLLKSYKLSDDIAFRFSNQAWVEFPLTADKYVQWLNGIRGGGDVVNLFMDYETFGEHQWAETGIFAFLEDLPHKLLAFGEWDFITPSQVIERYPVRAAMPFPRTVSWADMERDLTAWRGNAMQERALQAVYGLASKVKSRNNPELERLWRRLQTSDHFYYMCTKWFADNDVHAYFSPYDSPYDAFIYYMNVLGDLAERLNVKTNTMRALVSDFKAARDVHDR